MKIPDTTHYSLETFLLEKTPKPLRKGYYQVLSTNPCAAKLQGADSRIYVSHLKRAPNPDWKWTWSGDLKLKLSKSRQPLKETAFPKMTKPSLHISFSHCYFFISFSVLEGKYPRLHFPAYCERGKLPVIGSVVKSFNLSKKIMTCILLPICSSSRFRIIT